MLNLEPFFHSSTDLQLPPKAQGLPASIMDMETNKTYECLVFFHGLEAIF
jgi:hypothetical protein